MSRTLQVMLVSLYRVKFEVLYRKSEDGGSSLSSELNQSLNEVLQEEESMVYPVSVAAGGDHQQDIHNFLLPAKWRTSCACAQLTPARYTFMTV